ncbi:centrosomal protein of 85 kDa-like isoform X2 [Salvelinus fontinalis]|nr:centrosomal protein of 85 kDa-like isoform X2 [Salvelinus fontinalis]
MPSTAGPPASNPRPCSQEDSQASASSGSRTSGGTSNSKSSSLSKSASSPNLDMAQGGAGCADPTGPKPDCLSRYRSLVNGLDHSLFPLGDHSCMDEGQRFDMPTMEPTMNQSALLAGYCPDVRLGLQMTSLGETPEGNREAYRGAMEHSYKALPETRPGVPGAPDTYSQRSSQPGGTGAGSAGVYPSSLYLQTQALLREAKAYEPMLQERCSELPSWQQQHKQQLESLRMQVEQMQMMTAGVGQYPALYSTPSMPPETRKWDAVIKANESILKEKELAIERQKQQMSQLELRERELQVHGALLGGGVPYGDVCLLRLQEAQRENAFLRAQFAERGDCAAQEEAEHRLGAVEAETRRLNDALRETSERHAEEMKKQEERIRNRDKHINSLKKKCQKEAEQNREKQQRIETLERYLADLPTMEDYQGQSKQLKEVEQRAFQLQGRVRELEVCLEEARSHTREKDTQLEEQRRRERELLTTVTSLQERVQEGLEDGARLPSLDVEKLRGENSSLREEQQRLKKVIEKQLRMMTKLGTQIVTLEEQVSQEESSSHALREEVCSKEQGLLQLHTAMKELSAQNQELTEQNLTLHERLEVSEKVDRTSSSLRPARDRLTQRLHGEMASCLCDLRSLCNVLTQRSQGRDPNLSLLLGVSSPPPMAEQLEDWLSPVVLQRKLTEAQQLRRDVEELRTTISDRYAQDMGENCITQ